MSYASAGLTGALETTLTTPLTRGSIDEIASGYLSDTTHDGLDISIHEIQHRSVFFCGQGNRKRVEQAQREHQRNELPELAGCCGVRHEEGSSGLATPCLG